MVRQLRRFLNVVALALVAIVVWNEWRSRQRASAVSPAGAGRPGRVTSPSSSPTGSDGAASQATTEPEALVLPSPLGTPIAEEADDDSLPAVGRASAVETPTATTDSGSSARAESGASVSGSTAPATEGGAPVSSSTAVTAEGGSVAPGGRSSVQPPATTGDSGALANALPGDGTTDCPESHPIKGNASSMIYHEPGRASYARTIPEYCFATAEDAEAAGYRPPQR